MNINTRYQSNAQAVRMMQSQNIISNKSTQKNASTTVSIHGDSYVRGDSLYDLLNIMYNPYAAGAKEFHDKRFGKPLVDMVESIVVEEQVESVEEDDNSLTPDEILEKFATGGQMTKAENRALLQNFAKSGRLSEAQDRRVICREEMNLNEIFSGYDIHLREDEEIKIIIKADYSIEVSGLDDEEKLNRIKDALSRESNNLFWVYAATSETYNSLSDEEKEIVSHKLLADSFLQKNSNSKITVDDLYIKDGNVLGLPEDIKKSLEENELVKKYIYSVLEYQEKNGSINIDAQYSYHNGKLNMIEG